MRDIKDVSLELMQAVYRHYSDTGQIASALTAANTISRLTGRPVGDFEEIFKETFGDG